MPATYPLRIRAGLTLLCGVLLAMGVWPSRADVDLPTKFSNTGSIVNTRHNLTQSTIGAGAVTMNPYRNDYGEVCVYCHTPHGANTTIAAPLWNRTNLGTTYQVYSLVGGMQSGNTVTQPGVNSLTCLSCHDGTVAVDSIINMPGSGRYNAAQMTSQNNTFLNAQWTNPSGADASVHIGLSTGASGCLACHSSTAGIVGAGATSFDAFAIGTDLRNDHPVGIKYPTTGPGVDFNAPSATLGSVQFFDTNANGKSDKNEIKLYNSGDGFEVECSSCHDPHGVGPGPGGSGGPFNASFLRIPNTGSAVCTTCHVK